MKYAFNTEDSAIASSKLLSGLLPSFVCKGNGSLEAFSAVMD